MKLQLLLAQICKISLCSLGLIISSRSLALAKHYPINAFRLQLPNKVTEDDSWCWPLNPPEEAEDKLGAKAEFPKNAVAYKTIHYVQETRGPGNRKFDSNDNFLRLLCSNVKNDNGTYQKSCYLHASRLSDEQIKGKVGDIFSQCKKLVSKETECEHHVARYELEDYSISKSAKATLLGDRSAPPSKTTSFQSSENCKACGIPVKWSSQYNEAFSTTFHEIEIDLPYCPSLHLSNKNTEVITPPRSPSSQSTTR